MDVPIVSDALIEAAKSSYQRSSTAPEFFSTFYNRFFSVCPQIKPMFADTDFERQHKLLRHAIGLLLIFPSQPETEPTLLTRIAERHSRRDLNVKPDLYGPFIDCLVEVVEQYDPEFTSEIEDAWRKTVAMGVEYMKSRY